MCAAEHFWPQRVACKAVLTLSCWAWGCRRTRGALQRELGDKTGQALWDAAHGLDMRVVEAPKPRKSIGAEVNWGVRFATDRDAEVFLDGVAGAAQSCTCKVPLPVLLLGPSRAAGLNCALCLRGLFL